MISFIIAYAVDLFLKCVSNESGTLKFQWSGSKDLFLEVLIQFNINKQGEY